MGGAWLSVAAVLVTGWGVRRVLAGAPRPAPLVEIPLWGMAIWGAAMALASAIGVPWTPAVILLPPALALAAGLAVRRGAVPRRTAPGRAALAAAALTLPHAAMVAAVPSFGWDFRYIWGLKARAFALARDLDVSWLTWPPYATLHPGYPPLWPELLANGILLGGSAAATAAAWQAVLVVSLAAAGWEIARPARPALRILAAAAAAWSPVLLRPLYSGYADLLLAFLTAAAVRELARRPGASRASSWLLPVTAAALAAAKTEGILLALGAALGAAVAGRRRQAAWTAGAAVAVGLAWRLPLVLLGSGTPPVVLDAARIIQHARHAPGLLLAMVTPWGMLLAACWGLALAGLRWTADRPVLVMLGVWAAGIALAYLATPYDLGWHLAWSLDRVSAVPLPAIIALALSKAPRAATAPPSPDS